MKASEASAVFQVSDLPKSVAFYVGVLGFEPEFSFGEPPRYASVKRDAVSVHLCASPENAARRGHGSVYVFCDEVDGYFRDVASRGAAVTSPLSTQPYGMRDFQIKDPDGNLLGFGKPVG